MLFLTSWFGVTASDAERNLTREKSAIEEISQKSLLMQASAAAQQHRRLCRGTHAKGVCARAQFEVLDVAIGRDPTLAARLAKGFASTPGNYPAVVRFANADPRINSDFKPDVRSLPFSVGLSRNGSRVCPQDFSMQNATTLPINDIKYSATPLPDSPARPLQRRNPNGLQDELIRHLKEDEKMSGFDFGVQFLDAERMTYWGKHRDANFWIENASVEWHEAEAPFHTVARLTLLPNSQLSPEESETTYFDVTGNALPDSTPVGSINRARWRAEVACRKARMGAETAVPERVS
jgi:catalase